MDTIRLSHRGAHLWHRTAYVSYFTSQMRDVTDNVLWYFAQTLMYAGSIFGVAIAIDAKFENIKNKFFNHKNNETD